MNNSLTAEMPMSLTDPSFIAYAIQRDSLGEHTGERYCGSIAFMAWFATAPSGAWPIDHTTLERYWQDYQGAS
jgi:hypothetical protein